MMNKSHFVTYLGTQHKITHRSALISGCGNFRYVLTRLWEPGAMQLEPSAGRVVWLMLNPSTADGRTDDPTILRCMKFSASWGYLGMIVVNLFPFRSSSPKECAEWANSWLKNDRSQEWYVRYELHRNAGYIEQEAIDAGLCMAAFGANPIDYGWMENCLEEFTQNDKPIHVLGLNKAGLPIHPMARGRLRIPDSAMPQVWNRFE